MAPIKSRSNAKRTPSSFPTSSKTFSTTKRDKRIMKHSILLSKARTSSDKSSGVQKRRRPSKKLVTDIQSLSSALPTGIDDDVPSQSSMLKSQKIAARLQSITSNKGSKKRLQKVVKEEQTRFGKNLAILRQAAPTSQDTQSTGSQAAEASGSTAKEPDTRWAALRRHLASSVGVS